LLPGHLDSLSSAIQSLPPSARRNQLPSDKKQTRASLALEA
jgi:hypothetical protein